MSHMWYSLLFIYIEKYPDVLLDIEFNYITKPYI